MIPFLLFFLIHAPYLLAKRRKVWIVIMPLNHSSPFPQISFMTAQEEKIWSMSSDFFFFTETRHQLGLRYQFESLFWSFSVVLIHSWITVHMKILQFFWDTSFPNILKIFGLILDSSRGSTAWNNSFYWGNAELSVSIQLKYFLSDVLPPNISDIYYYFVYHEHMFRPWWAEQIRFL